MVHEYGHYIVAKKCGVFIEEFAIGIGPKIFSKVKDGTVYSVRILPLGGFCAMKDANTEDGEMLKDNDCFQNISNLKKIAIILAGVFMNFLLALIVFTGITMFSGIATNEVSGVVKDYPAYNEGIQIGDKIVNINGKSIRSYNDLTYWIGQTNGNPIKMVIKRGSEKINITLEPRLNEDSRYITGINLKVKSPIFKSVDGYEKTTIIDSVYGGVTNTIFMTKVMLYGLKDLVTLKVSTEELTGPIGLTTVIGSNYKESIKLGFGNMLLTLANITGLLSANIGLMNLIPIPALDGGRFILILVEILRGKSLDPKKEGIINFISFIFLIGLAIFVAFNDLGRIF